MDQDNSVTLIGNIGNEARLYTDKKSKLFAAFSMATRNRYLDKNEEWQRNDTVWHNVLTFNPTLVNLMEGFKKGTRIKVTGSLAYREFNAKVKGNKTARKREATIIARNIAPAPLPKKSAQPTPAPNPNGQE